MFLFVFSLLSSTLGRRDLGMIQYCINILQITSLFILNKLCGISFIHLWGVKKNP